MYDLDAATPAGDLGSACSGNALGKRRAVGADELDGVSRIKLALRGRDSDTEQARTLFDKRATRALVDVNSARDRFAEAEPELERRLTVLGGLEACASR